MRGRSALLLATLFAANGLGVEPYKPSKRNENQNKYNLSDDEINFMKNLTKKSKKNFVKLNRLERQSYIESLTCHQCEGGGIQHRLYPSGHTEVRCDYCKGEGLLYE